MLKMSAFSVDTGRQSTTPFVDGVVSQQTGLANNDTFITSLATHSLSNKQVNACPVLYIFPVSAVQKLLKSVKI